MPRRRKKAQMRPRKVYCAADLADAVGVHKMSILRYVENGRLPQPGLFLDWKGNRVWLWSKREFRTAVFVLRAEGRARRLQQFTKVWLATAGRALRKNDKREIAGVKIIWKAKPQAQ